MILLSDMLITTVAKQQGFSLFEEKIAQKMGILNAYIACADSTL